MFNIRGMGLEAKWTVSNAQFTEHSRGTSTYYYIFIFMQHILSFLLYIILIILIVLLLYYYYIIIIKLLYYYYILLLLFIIYYFYYYYYLSCLPSAIPVREFNKLSCAEHGTEDPVGRRESPSA